MLLYTKRKYDGMKRMTKKVLVQIGWMCDWDREKCPKIK